jgi:hypothetical protein
VFWFCFGVFQTRHGPPVVRNSLLWVGLQWARDGQSTVRNSR